MRMEQLENLGKESSETAPPERYEIVEKEGVLCISSGASLGGKALRLYQTLFEENEEDFVWEKTERGKAEDFAAFLSDQENQRELEEASALLGRIRGYREKLRQSI